MDLTPEQKARKIIDRTLQNKGWGIVNRDEYDSNMNAAALKEGLLSGNLEADYILFLNGEAVGVIEAKRKEVNICSPEVISQAENYTHKLLSWYKAIEKPLPLVYISNGEKWIFKNQRKPESEYEEISGIHSPKQIKKLLGIEDFYAGLPFLIKDDKLRECQYNAIVNLEKSFKEGKKKALINIATGAGKTWTACLASYRMLNYTDMKRVLFLVDRRNLGEQAEGEFGKFKFTENGDPFNAIFGVERLKSSNFPKDANVYISTIQKLFSFLKGSANDDEDIEDDDEETKDPGKPVILPENPSLPKDFFDMIIIDECHRSIYGNWKPVLDYFENAHLVGLTATPSKETVAFFDSNLVANYTLEESYKDRVNVPPRIYRIKTKVTEEGGAILEGDPLKKKVIYTGKLFDTKSSGTEEYSKTELNRSVINLSQIKLILETYKEAVYSEMFTDPQRDPNLNYLPKTLIFAENETHATHIVKIAKEVFDRDDDVFVQKITCKSGDSKALIKSFCTSRDFRIAVTVTLVATGTDVKPLEVVMFMRDVDSEQLYIQMKGRGVRTISDDALRNVTPNAHGKDCFFLVDAVGVTEHDHSVTSPISDPHDQLPNLKQLLERLSHGELPDNNLSLLASRLLAIDKRVSSEDKKQVEDLIQLSLLDLASSIFEAIEHGDLPAYENINHPNPERKNLVHPLTSNAKAKELLLIINAGYQKIIEKNDDELIEKGFSKEEAESNISNFEQYIEDHKDEIEALRIIYNNTGEPLTYSLLSDLSNKFRQVSPNFTIPRLWRDYKVTKPSQVKEFKTKEEKEAITNIIQLTRFAFHRIPELRSLPSLAAQRFELWCGQNQRPLTEKQKEIMQQIVSYIAVNGTATLKDILDFNKTLAAQMIMEMGNSHVNEVLSSLSQFLLLTKKTA